jgi:hypothetical protein
MRKFIVPALALVFLGSAINVYAGPGCSSSSKSASGHCSYTKSAAAMPEGMKIETARTAGGSLVVFYTSDQAEVVKTLHQKATEGADSFSCGVCREMATSGDCQVELVPFKNGVMAFVTSDKRESIDAFEKQYAALTTADTAPAAN